MIRSKNIIAISPGETIKEQLDDRGLNQKEFAIRMNMSEKHISKLINGEVQLTPDVAVRLEMVLGVSASFWSKLEALYREKIVKANLENELEAEQEIAKKLPYNSMAKFGWVPYTKNISERIINLRKFFEVVNLNIIEDKRISQILCRRMATTEKSDLAILVMAQQARKEAREIYTAPINVKKLENYIPKIRSLAKKESEPFVEKLIDLLAECGIAIVFLQHIGGSYLHGITFQDGKKIVLGITVRGKDSDKFWFSLFHELGHILLGHIKNTEETDEIKANQFAKEVLIPNKLYNAFIEKNVFTKETILSFAREIDILPGIVVGRLQNDGYIKYKQFNELKNQYDII